MRRLFVAFPFAILISYSLVGMMAWMVDLDKASDRLRSEPLSFDIFTNEVKELSQRKNRTLPPPPEKTVQSPAETVVQTQPNKTITIPNLEPIPDVNFDVPVIGMEIAASLPITSTGEREVSQPIQDPINADLGSIQQLMPIKRARPVYPRKALQRKIEGFVVLSFDINDSGKPINIEVKEAQPKNIFNREALKALKKWSYQPLVVNGVAQERVGQLVKLEFKIQ